MAPHTNLFVRAAKCPSGTTFAGVTIVDGKESTTCEANSIANQRIVGTTFTAGACALAAWTLYNALQGNRKKGTIRGSDLKLTNVTQSIFDRRDDVADDFEIEFVAGGYIENFGPTGPDYFMPAAEDYKADGEASGCYITSVPDEYGFGAVAFTIKAVVAGVVDDYPVDCQGLVLALPDDLRKKSKPNDADLTRG